MKVRSAAALGLATALLAVAVAAAGLRLVRPLSDSSVATVAVVRSTFVREVVAAGVLKAVRATPVVVPVETERAPRVAFLAGDGARVTKGEVVVRFDPAEATREAEDGRDDLAAARGKIARAEAEGVKTSRSLRLDRDLARDDTQRARTFELKDPDLFSRNEIVASTLDREYHDKKAAAAEQLLETSDGLSAAGVALGAIERDKALLRLGAAERGLRSMTIEAPHDGFFVLVRGRNGEATYVGDTLWPGEKFAEIPDLGELEARVYALEADAAGLRAGLPCRLRIEGRPGETHAAKVASVQPVARARERNSPVKYFETTVSLERTEPAFMRPGQMVEATIALDEFRDVIAIPRGALFEKDGRRIVYRQRGDRFELVEVSVGPNSLSRVVVTKGVAVGDRVAMRDPQDAAARRSGPPEGASPGGPRP